MPQPLGFGFGFGWCFLLGPKLSISSIRTGLKHVELTHPSSHQPTFWQGPLNRRLHYPNPRRRPHHLRPRPILLRLES